LPFVIDVHRRIRAVLTGHARPLGVLVAGEMWYRKGGERQYACMARQPRMRG
jgi:hypothetical protein